MRDAFGGTFMIKLTLIFFIIYVSLMAVAINYAKAFRVKNNVINIIEQYNYSGSSDIETLGHIDSYLQSVGYNYSSNTGVKNHCDNESNSHLAARGVCIVSMDKYYKVITYISIEFPFFQLDMTIPISGETKVIL